MVSTESKPLSLGPAPTRLRRIALVAEDLEKARHLLTTVLGTEVIYEDPAVEQWGLKNILEVPIGGDFIEVVSPFLPSAPAHRHLQTRGEGGYMIIIQTHLPTALTRLQNSTTYNLPSPIFTQSTPQADMVQYHPKSVPGGVIPELDSHSPHPEHPDPLNERFGPWHASGGMERYEIYREGMRRIGDLWLRAVSLRLADGDEDVEGAARKWERTFGVKRGDEVGDLRFTHATMRILRGEEGRKVGIEEVSVAIEGRERRDGILERARKEGLSVDGEVVRMLGVQWRFAVEQEKGRGWESKL